VTNFQRVLRLPETGEVDGETWACLIEL
jgi:hypothetical protein